MADVKSGAALVFEDVSKTFLAGGRAVEALRAVDIRIQASTVSGLIGPDGAGKTTTFRMLCGLLPVSSGEVLVSGLDLRRAAARARGRLGYMAQRFSLYVDLSVMQNIRFFASAYGLDRSRTKQRIAWALEAFELADFVNTNGRDLPLGYKQRLAMAAALMHEPDILFLDEPTSGVDPLARREFWQRINGLAESGVTVLVTTHFMGEANYCAGSRTFTAGHAGTADLVQHRGAQPQLPRAWTHCGDHDPDRRHADLYGRGA